jgi:phenylpropionate dioxygenase-like ring-hydroxylating dioxygenase large terminal subunit
MAMIDDPVLIDDWHPVALVAQLEDGGPIAARVLGEDIVLWRSGDDFFAWRDLCVHRGTRLSLGRVVDGVRLECPYHGWTYGADGQCVLEGILGDRARPEIEDYTTTIGADGVVSEGVKVYQPDPYATGHGSVVTYTYRVHRPLSASFIKHGEHSFGMLLSVTPHDAVDSTAWMWMAMNYEPRSSMVEFQDRIFAQDRPILESQRPELLPLDLQAELHLRSDRTAIAYRRWLRELGVRTGAS